MESSQVMIGSCDVMWRANDGYLRMLKQEQMTNENWWQKGVSGLQLMYLFKGEQWHVTILSVEKYFWFVSNAVARGFVEHFSKALYTLMCMVDKQMCCVMGACLSKPNALVCILMYVWLTMTHFMSNCMSYL